MDKTIMDQGFSPRIIGSFVFLCLTLFSFFWFVKIAVKLSFTWCATIRTIVQDYRAGKFYRPWKPQDNVVFVKSKKHIAELSDTPELSQRAAYADMFGFKHTLNGLNHNIQVVARTRLNHRLLVVNGQGNLPTLYPFLRRRLVQTLDALLPLGKPAANGFVSLPIAATSRVIASNLMSLIFFGENMSSEPSFAAALLQYPKDMVNSAAAFQFTPSFLSSMVHGYVTNQGRAMKQLITKIEAIATSGNKSWDETEELKNSTILHNMIELTEEKRDYWTPEAVSQAVLGIWFAAAHQPWMNIDFILLELCSRQEYIHILREEISDISELDYHALDSLPVLDSFVKETFRHKPFDTHSIRRKALKPFTFSEGPHVPAGSVACVSSSELMYDETNYPRPSQFDGKRFISCNSSMQGTRLTDVSENFPTWGFGSLACPGRFYASSVLKLSVAHLLVNFDMFLEDESAALRWSWETFTMPYESTRVLLRRRTL